MMSLRSMLPTSVSSLPAECGLSRCKVNNQLADKWLMLWKARVEGQLSLQCKISTNGQVFYPGGKRQPSNTRLRLITKRVTKLGQQWANGGLRATPLNWRTFNRKAPPQTWFYYLWKGIEGFSYLEWKCQSLEMWHKWWQIPEHLYMWVIIHHTQPVFYHEIFSSNHEAPHNKIM